MTAETGGPAAAGKGPEAVQPVDESQSQSQSQNQGQGKDKLQQQPAKGGDQQAKGAADAPGEKALTNAELKKKAKEEKAARRAQAKASQPGPPPGAGGQQGSQGDAKGAKGKPKQDAHQAPHGQKLAVRPAAAPKETKPAIPECFSHLAMARRIGLTQADKDVHPAVLMVGQHMAAFAVADSIPRMEITLLALKKVINSYTTPQGTTFSRHFTSHVLNPQIEYLAACRPMCFSMGNAIRWLKLQISKVDIDLADFEAKKLLSQAIENFIRDRIRIARPLIAELAVSRIDDGDVILTYGYHRLVEHVLAHAKYQGKDIRVIVVDDPISRTGLEFAKKLSRSGFGRVTYATDLGVLRMHLREATSVLVGAEAMFSNGALYARAGTSDIAVAAKDMKVKFNVLCESVNVTERVSIDSLTYNEIDPDRSTDDEFRLLFDTTRPEYITSVISELGSTAPPFIPTTMSQQEEL